MTDTPEGRRRLLALARLVNTITDPNMQGRPRDDFADRIEVQNLIWELEEQLARPKTEGKTR